MIPKIDLHIHSEFSFDSQDTTIEGIISIAEAKGLEKIAITDHGSARKPPWFEQYLSKIEKARKHTYIDVFTGMEVSIKFDGYFVVDNALLNDLDVVIGAVHHFPSRNLEEYVAVQVKAMEVNDFDILAHPTDRFKTGAPSNSEDRIIQKLKEEDIATEMNYHHRCPSPNFLQKCVNNGVKITPSSDAHRLTEIGHFEWFEQVTAEIKGEISWIAH
jgi:histidinol phosphatase-like PHP family hydrolase